MDTPESLFRRIEECQEIAVLGGAPYSVPQIVGNMMYLFLQSGIFPTREFETWDAVPAARKTWPTLKTFVQQAYQRKLIASSLRNTSGQMGYAPTHTQNAFNVFTADDESSVESVVTQIGAPPAMATTTGSTLGSTYQASTVPTELAAAIHTIAANQQALYQHVAPLTQQMAAMSYHARPPTFATGAPTTFIPQVPTYVGYQAGGYTGGQGGGFRRGVGGRGRSSGRGRARRHGRSRTAFADFVTNGGQADTAGQGTANRPNPIKIHNNWNVC
jgi:hypothetical protein